MLDYPYPCDFVTPMPANAANLSCSYMPPSDAQDQLLLEGLNRMQNGAVPAQAAARRRTRAGGDARGVARGGGRDAGDG